MDEQFNTNLKRIRKSKGVTQEQLAEAVGVSPQAVSKWEQGSYPDAQYLPVIADFLGVTIDELYGREKEKEVSPEQRLLDYFNSIPQEERLSRAFHMLYALSQSNCGVVKYLPLPDEINTCSSDNDWETHSQIEWESGILQARMRGNLQYFLLMPEPQCGYDFILAYDPDMAKLFRFLSSPDALQAMYFLAGRRTTSFFTAKALSGELGINPESAEKILEDMLELKFVWAADINSGEKSEKAYQYTAGLNFLTFINFSRTLMKRPYSYNHQTSNRNSPYFKKDTYKNQGGISDEKEKRE